MITWIQAHQSGLGYRCSVLQSGLLQARRGHLLDQWPKCLLLYMDPMLLSSWQIPQFKLLIHVFLPPRKTFTQVQVEVFIAGCIAKDTQAANITTAKSQMTDDFDIVDIDLCDPSHLLKSIRNYLQRHVFEFGDKLSRHCGLIYFSYISWTESSIFA